MPAILFSTDEQDAVAAALGRSIDELRTTRSGVAVFQEIEDAIDHYVRHRLLEHAFTTEGEVADELIRRCEKMAEVLVFVEGLADEAWQRPVAGPDLCAYAEIAARVDTPALADRLRVAIQVASERAEALASSAHRAGGRPRIHVRRLVARLRALLVDIGLPTALPVDALAEYDAPGRPLYRIWVVVLDLLVLRFRHAESLGIDNAGAALAEVHRMQAVSPVAKVRTLRRDTVIKSPCTKGKRQFQS